ncbi:tRNA (cytosine(32)/uridine(32)-2'-O)-methyltransferase TrmJ [Ningiella sp. W23]|uniref:tRNA (cytosine(32)/uridine(32)-2'-O)-methyltransferase TrmJ n=1 Tax=Ningiella sp. W23 TaxID=3023715 RepID=UPI0037579611
MLEAIRIVLVNTTHTGNIGSTARAMKTMGLSSLYLVGPKTAPDGKSSALAAGAGDVLGKATIVDTLEEAIGDCGLVIGTSMRTKTLSWPMLSTRETAAKLNTEVQHHPVALVFGRESNGLSNDELRMCHFHTFIEANPDYSSLNLAAAVQTFCYEIRMDYLATERANIQAQIENEYPLAHDLARFYVHLESTLEKTRFIRKSHPGLVMEKLKRLFNRARPEALELNILRGILASIDKQHQKLVTLEQSDNDEQTKDSVTQK